MTAKPESNGFFCGVDIGASATKVVIIDAGGKTIAGAVMPSGVDYANTAGQCLDRALAKAGLGVGDMARTVSTGYGRANVPFADASMTEIHCHGVGCHHHITGALSLVDIGGQDNKVIHLGVDGRRLDFMMNRKCAAGTGAFIEEIALRLGVDLGEMNGLAASTDDAVRLSSFCTVFAKTEILAHLRKGAPVASIVRGAFVSVITRVIEMDPLNGAVALTGGVVAHNPVVADILSKKLGRPVRVPPNPQLIGALGAALVAKRQFKDESKTGKEGGPHA
ncbi:MAG: ATPase [Deltaproteobacteria bacterium]|nr:ATPase [Deltaproteobacteria bacterium]